MRIVEGTAQKSHTSLFATTVRHPTRSSCACCRTKCVQIVNVWPFRIPVLGLYAKFSGYLNIRMMSQEEFLAQATKLLVDGVSIIFFPEGTRSASRTMGSFHGAAFRLALESKAAVVPLCITGNENIPPKGSLLLRPGTIRVPQIARHHLGRVQGPECLRLQEQGVAYHR